MPIYEYRCEACGAEFEKLVFGREPKVACDACGSERVVKKMSTFGMSGVEKPFAGDAKSGCSSCTKSSCSSCH